MNEATNRKILIIDDNEDLLKAAKIFSESEHFAQWTTRDQPDLLSNPDPHENYDVILLT